MRKNRRIKYKWIDKEIFPEWRGKKRMGRKRSRVNCKIAVKSYDGSENNRSVVFVNNGKKGKQ